MIAWLKRLFWRKKLESKSRIVITIPVLSQNSSSSVHSLRELRELLESGNFETIIKLLATKLKEAGLNDREAHRIIQGLNEERMKVIIERVGLFKSLERRETERHVGTSSSPIS